MSATPLGATRRAFLLGAAALPVALCHGRIAFAAAPGDRRLVFIILRGAMDGLHAVPPVGDPDYAGARGGLALSRTGAEDTALDIGHGTFALHPALMPVLPLWQAGQFAIIHAVATPYRDRSHFDGQDVLETGGTAPHLLSDGWIGRSLAAMGADSHTGLAVGLGVPVAARGPVAVSSWAPSPLPGLAPEELEALHKLYQGDRLFARALDEGAQSATMVDVALSGDMDGGEREMAKKAGDFHTLGGATGKLLAAPDGPRVAVMEVYGWDTHVGQGKGTGRMAQALAQLAGGVAAMRDAMGPAWDSTIVVAASEFGRTVAENGTNGTDHGTGTAALLWGGAVAGGRVVTDWPGLSRARLYQGRDLAATTDLRAVLKGVLRDHMGVEEAALSRAVFPDSAAVRPMGGLVRT